MSWWDVMMKPPKTTPNNYFDGDGIPHSCQFEIVIQRCRNEAFLENTVYVQHA